MQFLNPAVLLALAAALIPLMLHFLTLRKPRPFLFSSLRFLQELQRSTVRRFRLRQLLLLLVRMALIATIVLAFARPALPGRVPLLGTRAPVSVVLLVDNSASMGLVESSGERFQQLQEGAERFIRSLQAEDEIALLPMVPPPQWHAAEWGSPRGAILQDLKRLTVQPGRGDLLAALEQAALLLQQASHVHRFVIVLSDFQRSALPELPHELRLFDARTSLYAVRVGAEAISQVVLVIDSVALESQLRALGEPVRVSARVRAFGHGQADAMIGLFWGDERVAQQRVTLRAGEAQTVVLSGTPERPGFLAATVVAEGTTSTLGERRFAGFAVAEPFPVGLIVDDDGSRRFVESALSAFPASQPPFQLQLVPPSALETVDLSAFRVLVIASAQLTFSHLQRIESFLRAGGGVVMLAAGGRTAELLPMWLARFGLRAREHQLPETQPATLTSADRRHPLFAGVFTGDMREERLPEAPALRRLITLEGGIPLLQSSVGTVLVEQRVGQGSLFFCGLAADPTWGEFPRSGLFPTVLVRATLLTGPAAAPVFFYEAGERAALTLPTSAEAVVVRDPTGGRYTVPAMPLSSGTRLELGQLQNIGLYELTSAEGTPLATLNSNIPTAELQLAYADEKTLTTWFGQLLSPAASFRYLPSVTELLAHTDQEAAVTELWRYFLGMALVLAVLELALARQGRSNAEPRT